MVSIFEKLTFIVSTIGYKQRNDSSIESSKRIPRNKLFCSLYCNNWILKVNTTSELESSKTCAYLLGQSFLQTDELLPLELRDEERRWKW